MSQLTKAQREALKKPADKRPEPRFPEDAVEGSEASEEQELYEHHRIVCDKGQGPLRLDKFLFERLPNISRNRIATAARGGHVRVNGKAQKPSYQVKPMDDISMVLPWPVREVDLQPENIPLTVIYEDAHILIIDKQAGLVVHPGHGNWSGTLVNALLYHFGQQAKKVGEMEARPGLVHRLDKNTSGVMVIGKTDEAMTHLARQFFDRTNDRRYLAMVWGDLEEEEGTIEGNIGRSPKDRTIMQVFPDGDHGKTAITHWKMVERFTYVSLVECKLETGRTHQIRAHMRYLGHQLFNDAEYDGSRVVKGTVFTKYKQFVLNAFEICPRQALHAAVLEIEHPATGKRMRFESPLPPDMSALVEKWRKYAEGGVQHKVEEEEEETEA
jgi:23S rRNA pseudouridine1911/1915/1917 synthase